MHEVNETPFDFQIFKHDRVGLVSDSLAVVVNSLIIFLEHFEALAHAGVDPWR